MKTLTKWIIIGLAVWLSLLLWSNYSRIVQPDSREPVRIRLENFDLIKPGMSRREVVRLLGAPPGDYRRTDGVFFVHVNQLDGNLDDVRCWICDQGEIQVAFERDEVIAKQYFGGDPSLP
jgi:hypothetical protein